VQLKRLEKVANNCMLEKRVRFAFHCFLVAQSVQREIPEIGQKTALLELS
jgi:hypothetical protein